MKRDPYLRLPLFAPDDGLAAGGAGAAAAQGNATAGAAASGGAASAGTAGAATAGSDGGSTGGKTAGGTAASTSAGSSPAFADTLPADLREMALFKDIKDMDGLARSYANAAKMVGMDKAQLVALPADDSDPAAMEAIYNKLGRPEKPDGYKLSPVELPEGLPRDAELEKTFLGRAHELGLSTKQADGLFKWWSEVNVAKFAEADKQLAAAHQAANQALKADWGAAYDAKIALAGKAINQYQQQLGLGDGLVKELEAGLGNNPALAKLFAHLGEGISEPSELPGRTTGRVDQALSPTEAKQEINALHADEKFMKAYTTKEHPGHPDAVKRMQRLYEFAHPSAS